ncbi:MAG: hypothetical protein KC996_01180 [Phycisphaerales bacterium]|nr:hypothetical protein [Phycisphaerales bacterium]
MRSVKIRPVSVCMLVAASGLATNAYAIDWAAAVDGNWNVAGNWSPATVPNTIGDTATLGFSGVYTVTISNTYSIGSLVITNPDAILGITSNTLNINTGMSNNGTVFVNSDLNTFNSVITFDSDASITGSGSVLLGGIGQRDDAQITSIFGFTLTNTAAHTIRGNGQINGTVINDGTIVADTPGGAGLVIKGAVSGGGMAGADAGQLYIGGSASVIGNELFTVNGGTIFAEGTSTIGGLTISGDLVIPTSTTLQISDDLTLNGTVNINPEVSVFNSMFRFETDATIDGNGTITLWSAGDPADAVLTTQSGITGTLGPNITVEGSGRIGTTGTLFTIVNNGVINGNDPSGEPLVLLANQVGFSGVYRADNGRLAFGNNMNMTGGIIETTGTGIVDTNGSTSRIASVTNNGQMGVRGGGHNLYLSGPFTNNGDVLINSTDEVFNALLRFEVDTQISGTGTITMQATSNTDDARIFVNAGITGAIGSGQTVQGSGRLEVQAAGTLINNGTVIANDPDFPLQLHGDHASVSGVYRGDNGVLSMVNASSVTGGTFESAGTGAVEASSGTVTIHGATSTGAFNILGSGTDVRLTNNFTNTGAITINSNNDVFNARLISEADVDISGAGSITMLSPTNTGDAVILALNNTTLTIGSGQTVQGSGVVIGQGVAGVVHNAGVFIGNDPLMPLELEGNHTSSGIYRGDNGVLGLVNNSKLVGGTFESAGTGSVDGLSGTMTLTGVTNNGVFNLRGSGTNLDLMTDLPNNGTININSTDDIFNATLRAQADVAVTGTGTITMRATSNTSDANINSNGFAMTIGSGQTITGSGRIQGAVTVEGTIDPNNAPTLRHIDVDALTLTPTSEYVADLGGLASGEFDQILLNGGDTIDLGGATVTVNLDSGYVPIFGDSWDIIDGGTIIGSFGTVNVPAAPTAQIYRVVEEPNRVFAVLTCQADFTGDNFLDVFDVFLFLDLFNDSSPRADFTGDGVLDIFDVFLFLDFYNGGCTGI